MEDQSERITSQPPVEEPTSIAETVAEEAKIPTPQAAEAEQTPTPATEAPETVASEPVAEAAQAPAKPAPAKPVGPRITDLKPGMIMEGTVTRIERYGAFVNLGLSDRRDGLIHISEIAPYRIRRVEDVVQVGNPVRARIVSVDLSRGRIALSLNDVPEEGTMTQAPAPVNNEPAMTAMEMAFERAYGRLRDDDGQAKAQAASGAKGDRAKREHEELMRRLQS